MELNLLRRMLPLSLPAHLLRPTLTSGLSQVSWAITGHFIKGFAHIAAPLYDLISGDNKDKKSEPVKLSPEALEAFNILKEKCVNAPVLSFPDFKKPFLLKMDASGKGLGAVLSQKQNDGRYHPVAYASQTMNETEQ